MPCSRLIVLAALIAMTIWGRSASAQLQYPNSIAVSGSGDLFIGDRELPGIWKLADGKLEKYFEGSKQFRTPLNSVTALAFDREGRLLAGDSATREVYRFDEAGKPTPLTEGSVGIPLGIAVGADGTLFVSDLELHTIWKVPAAGGKPEAFAEVQGVSGIALDDQQRLWAISRNGQRLVRLGADGQEEVIVKQGTFEFPHTVVLADDGNAFITDGYGHAIWKLVADGAPEKLVSGSPLRNPVGMAASGDNLVVVDPGAKAVFQISKEGQVTQLFPTEAVAPE